VSSAATPLLESMLPLLTKCWSPTLFLKKSIADYAPSLRCLISRRCLPRPFVASTTESPSACCSSTIKVSVSHSRQTPLFAIDVAGSYPSLQHIQMTWDFLIWSLLGHIHTILHMSFARYGLLAFFFSLDFSYSHSSTYPDKEWVITQPCVKRVMGGRGC
jgi:hypothetical protein